MPRELIVKFLRLTALTMKGKQKWLIVAAAAVIAASNTPLSDAAAQAAREALCVAGPTPVAERKP